MLNDFLKSNPKGIVSRLGSISFLAGAVEEVRLNPETDLVRPLSFCMKRFLPICLLFLFGQCFFAVDWSKGSGPKGAERAVLEEVPETRDSNLSRSELQRKSKAGKKSKDDSEPFDLISGQGENSSARNCSVVYNNCKDKCWKEFPTPSVETVFTAITVDRKRWECVGRCRNCDNFDSPSSSGTMPNSGKGNYSDPNAPRY